MRAAQLALLLILIAVVACSGGQAPRATRTLASHNNLRVLKEIRIPQERVGGFRFFHRLQLAGSPEHDVCEVTTSYDRRRDFPLTILTPRDHTVAITESYVDVNDAFDHKTIQIVPDDHLYLSVTCRFKSERADLSDVNRMLEGQMVIE